MIGEQNSINREVFDARLQPYYPKCAARHAMGAGVSHFREDLSPFGRDASSTPSDFPDGEFLIT